MPFEELPDLFTQNSQRLANTHGWMSPLSAFAIAQSASSPDDAEQIAGALRSAHVKNSPDPLGGFFDDGRLYDKPPAKLKFARYLRGTSGPLPVASQNIRDTQALLNKKGFGNMPVTGVWSSEWQGAMYEYNQHQMEKHMASGGGKGFSVNKALDWLTGTMPAGALDAAIGFVKGIPEDLRNVVADLAAGVENVGYDAFVGSYNQLVNGQSQKEMTQYGNQIMMGHTAAIKNFLGGDTSAAEEAKSFGVSLKDLQSDKHTGLDNWDMAHRYLGDIGTVFLLASAGKAAAGFLDAAETQMARGVTEKATFRTPKIIGKKLFGLEVANPEVLTYADEIAMPGAISGTFAQGGSAGTQAFKNIPSLVEDLPVLRGTYGWHLGENAGKIASKLAGEKGIIDPLGRAGRIWYGARTIAAGPQIFPSVRIAGAALHGITSFGIRARLTAATTELGPGTNELASSIQDEHTVQHWNEQNMKQYGALANIDNLMFLFHAPPGTKGVSPGTLLAEEIQARNANIREAYNSLGIPQAWERFSKMSHTESKTWEDFVKAVGGENRAQRWVNKKLNDYALQVAAKEMAFEQGSFADEADAFITAEAIKAGELPPTYFDDAMRAKVSRQVEQKMHYDMKDRLMNEPDLLAQAHLRGLSDYEQDGFVKWLAQDFNLSYADRKAPGRLSWADHSGDMNTYIDASDIFHRDVLSTLQANITGMAENVDKLNVTALDRAADIPALEKTLKDAKAAFAQAKRTEKTALFGERNAAQKALKQAGRAVEDAEKAVIKAHEEIQVTAEKARIEAARVGLSDLEKAAKGAEKVQAAAESNLVSGKASFGRGQSTLERAIELGMTKDEFDAARKEAGDAAAALAKKDIEPKTPIKVVRATLAEARKKGASAYDREIRAKSLEAGGKTSHQLRAADLGMTEEALKTAENEAVAASKKAAEDAGQDWDKFGWGEARMREAVIDAFRHEIAANATSVKPLQAEVDKAVAETASKWAELHAAVAKEGAVYEPTNPYQTRFAMESRPTMPHPDPRGAIDPALVTAQSDAAAEATLARSRSIDNYDPRTHALYGGHGRPLAPELTAAQQAVHDAADALFIAKAESKQVDADLTSIGILTNGKKTPGTVRDIGIQGHDTLSQEPALEQIAKFRDQGANIEKEIQTQRRPQSSNGKVISHGLEDGTPKVEDEFEWDLPGTNQAQMRKDFEVYSKIDFSQMEPEQYKQFKALDGWQPPQERPQWTHIGMTYDDWLSYSDAQQNMLRAAVKTQDVVKETNDAANAILKRNDLMTEILAWGFQHFAIGAEQSKALSGVEGINSLLDLLTTRAESLPRDVILAADADPALIQAAADLDALGYKLVQGKNLGFLTVPETAADHLEFVRTEWTKRALTRMGLSTEVVLNSTIPVAQQANRMKRYAALATKFARPGVDALSIERLMQLIRSNGGDLEEVLKGTESIAGVSFGERFAKGANKAFGGLGKGETTRLKNALDISENELSNEITDIMQLRDLRPKRVISILTNQKAMDSVFGVNESVGLAPISRVQAFTKEEANAIYRETVKSYSVSFRFAGLSQLDNLFRASAQWVGTPGWATTAGGATVLGAGTGLAVGTARGDDPKDLLRDVGIGAAAGLALSTPGIGFKSYANTVGWSMANMPNSFKIASNRFRFALSPSFSISRVVKTNLKLVLEGITPSLRPLKSIGDDAARIARQSEEYKYLTKADAEVFLQNAKDEAIKKSLETVKRVFPELNNSYADAADDADRFLQQQDVFGLYNGRSHEMAAAYALEKQGLADHVIREKLIHMFTYGREGQIGRSAMERSANFIFFPFSFDKTLYRNVGVYLLDRPAQQIMMRQTLAAYNDFSKHHSNTPGAAEWIKGHLPLLEEVQRLNAFQHGLSLGELGGVNAPLLQLFIPQQWRSTSENTDVLKRYIPVLKDFERIKENVLAQAYVVQAELTNLGRAQSGTPNFFANPARSVLAPSEQLHDAFKYQNQLYKEWGEKIADNKKTRDPNKKWIFSEDLDVMGKYAGQEITSAQIKNMVQDRYPGYNSLLGSIKAIENNDRIAEYGAKLNAEGEDKLKVVFEDFNKGVGKFGRLLQDETEAEKKEYQAWGEKWTGTFRAQAIYLAKKDPRFYELYKTAYQRILGPLEKVE